MILFISSFIIVLTLAKILYKKEQVTAIYCLSIIGSFWKSNTLQISLHHYRCDEVHIYDTVIQKTVSPNKKKIIYQATNKQTNEQTKNNQPANQPTENRQTNKQKINKPTTNLYRSWQITRSQSFISNMLFCAKCNWFLWEPSHLCLHLSKILTLKQGRFVIAG